MVEVEINGIKYVLRRPTFKLVTEIEDECIELDENGKPRFKKGIGYYKRYKLFRYLEAIGDKKNLSMKDIDELDPKVAVELLRKIDEMEGGNGFRG